MVNINPAGPEIFDDGYRASSHNECKKTICKVGYETWEAKDGLCFQQVKSSLHIEKQPYTCINVEITNLSPFTNFWVDEVSGRVFELMHKCGQPILLHSDSNPFLCRACMLPAGQQTDRGSDVGSAKPPSYQSLATLPITLGQPANRSVQETGPHVDNFVPPPLHSNTIQSDKTGVHAKEKDDLKAENLHQHEQPDPAHQVQVTYASENNTSKETAVELACPTVMGDLTDGVNSQPVATDDAPKRLTISEDSKQSKETSSTLQPDSMTESNGHEADGAQMCDDSTSFLEDEFATDMGGMKLQEDKIAHSTDTTINIVVSGTQKKCTAAPCQNEKPAHTRTCEEQPMSANGQGRIVEDKACNLQQGKPRNSADGLDTEAETEECSMKMDINDEFDLAENALRSKNTHSPVGLLDGLSDLQQDEMASLREPLYPTGVLVDLDEEHETTAGSDICLFSVTLPLESNENIRCILDELEGLDFTSQCERNSASDDDTPECCVAESTRCDPSSTVEADAVQSETSDHQSYNGTASSGFSESRILSSSNSHAEGACAEPPVSGHCGFDDFLMADESGEYDSGNGTFDMLMMDLDKIFSNAGVKEWRSLADPGDSKKIFIFSQSVRTVQDELHKAASVYGGYKLVLRNRAEIFKPLCGFKARGRMPFTLTTWKTDQRGVKRVVDESTCGMIVRGEDLWRNGRVMQQHSTDKWSEVDHDYWAVASAHHILTQKQRKDLSCVDDQHFFDIILKELCSPTNNLSFGLVAKNKSGDVIDVVGPPLFRQWHYMPLKGFGSHEFERFANDILLFRLDYSQLKGLGWLEKDPSTGLSRFEVLSGPFSLGHSQSREGGKCKYVHGKIKGVVPLRSIQGYGRLLAKTKRGIQVLANGKLGTLKCPNNFIKTESGHIQGHHLVLSVDDEFRFSPGESGSIVYTISKTDMEQVYAMGMLVGSFRDKELSCQGLYQAIALWPALRQIEHHHSTRIKNIRLIGSDDVKDKESDDLLDDFADSGVFMD